MTVKAGQLITTGDTVLVERLQTGGPNSINVPSTRINELGNYLAVAVSHDIPDLTFSMESYDATCSMEALLTKLSGSPGPYPISAPSPIDVASEWLAGQENGDPDEFAVVEGVGLPYLMLDSLSYRVGVNEMSQKSASLRGDSIYYCPGAVEVQKFVASGSAGQALALTDASGLYNGDTVGGPRRTLNVTANGVRLIFGVDYTETYTGSGAFQTTTVHVTKAQATGSAISVMYFTNVATSFLQNVHSDVSVVPASLRGKDVTITINGTALTNRWTGVQSVQIDERFSITRNEELGNAFATSIEYLQSPDVTGNFVVRANNPADLHDRIKQLMNVGTSTEAIGATTFHENRVDIFLHHPDTGAVLEVVECPDAVVTLPPFSGRVNQPVDVTFSWQSDSGTLFAYDDVSELPA